MGTVTYRAVVGHKYMMQIDVDMIKTSDSDVARSKTKEEYLLVLPAQCL